MSDTADNFDFHAAKREAKAGDAGAQYDVGLTYEYGKSNYKKAAKWYKRSANQGFAPAQNSLGELYKEGNGVKQNYMKAMDLFKKAAKQGDANAQFNLGQLYEFYSNGSLPQLNKAAEWYRKAAAQGHEQAKSALSRM